MAGPNIEVFKFGLYMFFPVWIMFKFGDPAWYTEYVQPYKDVLFPQYETTNKPPKTQPELKAELARLKEARALKRAKAETETTASTANGWGSSSPAPISDTASQPDSLQGLTAKSFYGGYARPTNQHASAVVKGQEEGADSGRLV
ncbi:hypothetical protein DB88DRAFT_493514 [Papiliotrema laurentii]|uniref:Uncharacterized protein n=1 Tax=Papiliotrema laurentii TaxID=5418 RepID=A0AAD9CW29_PAPLA|nr:hypothetical protein DB88DRAFT_493514 [Papiliotrema laurentii]